MNASGPITGIGWRHAHYAEVVESRPAIDFLEVHSENFFADGGAALAVLERGRALYPVSVHGVGLSLGAASGLDTWHLDQLARLVKRIDPVRVSDHASFARGVYRGEVVHAADLLPIAFTDESLDVLSANVSRVQDRLKRRFVVENLSSYLTWTHAAHEKVWPEAAFLMELVRRTGCQLLVDVNNIFVNARNAQLQGALADPVQSCREWLNAISPDAVAEIHLAGHCHVNDEHGEIIIDDHGSRVCEPVWALYSHAIKRFGQVPTLIEWDTDVPALSVLLDEAGRARKIAANACQPEFA